MSASLCVYFRNTVVFDFEYEIEDGGLPHALCMVAYVLDAELRHVDTIKLWRGEFGSTPPFDIGPDTLAAGYSLWADLTCFRQLDWRFPVHVFDQHTAWLATSNILLPYEPDEKRVKQRKRLADACRAYGITGWENIDKPEMAKDIGEGRWHKYGQAAVFDYCEEDVRKSVELLRRQLLGYRNYAPVDPHRVMEWSNYSAKTVARVQAHGMAIDMPLWDLVQEHKAAVVAALIMKFDPTQGECCPRYRSQRCPIYSLDGEFSEWRFEYWLGLKKEEGGADLGYWPRLDSGRLQLDGDAFRMMAASHPAIEGIHALRDALNVIIRARIPINGGRNRPSLFPFLTSTGRNAQSKSLFNAHASMRSFLIAPPGKILVYLDWRTQEVGIAAARSGDKALMEDYASGDVYHALAKLCGLTNDPDIKRWKANNSDQRQRMKALQLGINYGMGVRSLSRGLKRHPLIGSEVIIRHKQRYTTFWPWREATAEQTMLDRVIYSEFDGWPMHLSHSPNKRTIYNFPMQAGGAEMLRLAANRLCDADLVPSMLVHDGILFELDNEEQARHAIEIMRKAGTEVCGGFEIGVDKEQWASGSHYVDKRDVAKKMWAVVMGVLREIGAIPAEAG